MLLLKEMVAVIYGLFPSTTKSGFPNEMLITATLDGKGLF